MKLKCSRNLIIRLKKTSGQMNGIMKMMENDSSCEELAMQLRAVRNSIDKILALMAVENLLDRIEDHHQIELENIDDAVDLLVKYR